jgi:transcriptional regulator with XRE-family HTH domain
MTRMAIKPQAAPRECFAENLQLARQRLGLSQQQLALRCGLSRTEISLFERRARSPRLEMIVALSKALGLESGELLEGLQAPESRSVGG